MKRGLLILLIVLGCLIITGMIPQVGIYNATIFNFAVSFEQKWVCHLMVGKSEFCAFTMGCNEVTKEECLSITAGRRGDAGSCEGLENEYQRNNCYSLAGQADSNESLCMKTTDDSFRGSCLNFVAEKKKDTQICNLLENENSKEGCIMFATIEIVKETKNFSQCAFLAQQGLKNQCYTSLATYFKNITLCDYVIDLSPYRRSKDDCYEEVTSSR